jgi:uncharacterized membrane protein
MSTLVVPEPSLAGPEMASTTATSPSQGVTPRYRPGDLVTTALLLGALDVAVSHPHFLAARLLALAVALLLPGALAVEASRARFGSRYAQAALVLGAGVAVIMGLALVMSTVLPSLGVKRPLDREPFAIGLNLVVVALALVCPKGRDPVLNLVKPSNPLLLGRPQLWHLVLLLPVLAIIGVERLNSGHSAIVVQLTIGASALALVLGFLEARAGRHKRAQMVLFCAALALLYLFSFRGNYLFGYDIQQEFQRFSYTFGAGRWSRPADGDPYASMLSITALPAAVSKLTSISGMYLFKGLYPVFVALVPGLSYELARRWLNGGAAFVGAAYMIVLTDFSSQLVALARQETAFLFFALLVVALFADELSGKRRQAVIAALLAALVVSHYSTSYVAVALLGCTWLGYGLLRLLLRRRPAPAVGLVTVLLGIGMIVGWDVVYTHSTHNVTKFVASMAVQGLRILPYGKGESLVQRYLSGNVGTTMSPAQYYVAVGAAARASEPWLHPYPASLTRLYPAHAAPATYSLPALLPGSAPIVNDVMILVDELLLFAIACGVALSFLQRLTKRGVRAPLEVSVMLFAFLAFLALIRLSGTVAGSYNADRAQLQASIVLAVALGMSAEWLIVRLRAGTLFVGALILMLLAGTGETAVLTGGSPSAILANSGTQYDYFVISGGEVSAARWLVANMGPHHVVYTDDFGPLRIWDATSFAPLPHTWLTPTALDQGAWVYATASDVTQGRAYGSISGARVSYRFPARFLQHVDDLVYSDPTARVYH